ncbi:MULTISPECIES: cell wall hydrolase [unclassified Pseudomonas]|uniref:Cell wall hydrolase n=1 Tax=Pseudomonas sp. Hg7Tf TaxID=3236988 RepID=A0AB39I3Q7_9PSED|nr:MULTISPECIES: cell wall hydrolase [unclassified Pseudomonas]KJK08320.1 hydrolase [Pseudomonas sp. 5]MDH2562154.1 cell wall hydrolase [Pseudomonas sp. Hg5Tf]
MRLATIVTCLFLAFSAPLAVAAEPKAKVAEEKAHVLEQKAVVQPDAPPAPKSKAISQTEVQAVDPAGQAALDDAITCMARSIYWESKGGKSSDMQAVANVVMNRLGHEGFPDTVCGVVKQGSETGNCQFSWWCDGRSDSVQEETRYSIAKEIARKALNRQLDDRTQGALYFHDRNVSPNWAHAYVKTTETSDFLFYKPRNGTAR